MHFLLLHTFSQRFGLALVGSTASTVGHMQSQPRAAQPPSTLLALQPKFPITALRLLGRAEPPRLVHRLWVVLPWGLVPGHLLPPSGAPESVQSTNQLCLGVDPEEPSEPQ